MKRRSVLAELATAPHRFGFDAAVRVLTRARRSPDPAEIVRFRTPPGLVYPPADVLDVDTGAPVPQVTVGLMGLTGPSGVLPRSYTEAVTQARRGRSTALHDFLDTLGHRFVAFFARAAIKYRPARVAETATTGAATADPAAPGAGDAGLGDNGLRDRNPIDPDPIAQVLLSAVGYGTPHLTPRLLAGTDPILHYAGLFAMRPRSADRLRAIVSDWLGMPVEVIEFAGAWLNIPPDQRTRIGAYGAFSGLAVDAAAGVRAWDPQARVILRIGPLDGAGFARLLPDRLVLHRVVSLVRAYLGFELAFAVNPVLAADAIPPLQMNSGADPAPRLGWNTWLPGSAGGVIRQKDATDAIFEADVIEAHPIAAQERTP